ncbi:MAG TPA: tRNA-binding protein [Longimicrobiales bacterium]|nr:tRNA-binding protein [Longimicrobiales bacterium]
MSIITYDDFSKVEIRVGRVERAEPFPEARRPSLRLWIDFGEPLGVRKTSAQLAVNYLPDELVGRMVVAVTNFPPKQIGKFMSEVLVLGVPDAAGEVVLLRPDSDVPLGGRMY